MESEAVVNKISYFYNFRGSNTSKYRFLTQRENWTTKEMANMTVFAKGKRQ